MKGSGAHHIFGMVCTVKAVCSSHIWDAFDDTYGEYVPIA